MLDRNTLSIPDHQPLSQSLGVPVWNQDTILEGSREGVNGSDCSPEPAREGVWEGKGESVSGERRRRTSSIKKMVMWVVTEDNRYT